MGTLSKSGMAATKPMHTDMHDGDGLLSAHPSHGMSHGVSFGIATCCEPCSAGEVAASIAATGLSASATPRSPAINLPAMVRIRRILRAYYIRSKLCDR